MVLVKLSDGTEHGWVINRPAYASWHHDGMTASGSARGHVNIGIGEFYRRAKDRHSRQIEGEMHRQIGSPEAVAALEKILEDDQGATE